MDTNKKHHWQLLWLWRHSEHRTQHVQTWLAGSKEAEGVKEKTGRIVPGDEVQGHDGH